jgi:cobalt-zinc-cadmium efflux system protein
MPHNHNHEVDNYNQAFAIGVILNLAFVIAEATFGVLSDSLALLADAGHNLSDVLGLLLAWGASILARRQASMRRTYGMRKSTVLAALANAVILMVVIGGISWEAVKRFSISGETAGTTIIAVAAIGVLINTATALLFLAGRKEDLNIRGAFLHMAADAGVSLGVVLGGIAILYTGWVWIDPALSLVIAVVILFSTWDLLKDSLNLIMDAVPEGIDPADVLSYLEMLPGVTAVHDLHIWGMSTTESALTAHLVKPNPEDDDAIIEKAGNEIYDRFGIQHITLQWERSEGNRPCNTCE